jgi:hypothetical protein
MIRFIYEIVCRFTYTVKKHTSEYQLLVFVTTISGEAGNWTETHIPNTVRLGASVVLSESEESWANNLNEYWDKHTEKNGEK